MQVSDVIFREYDIRGVVGDHLNGALAFELGCAYGSLVKSRIEKQQLTVAVGRDCRVSGPELTERLVEGIRSTGVNVIGSGMGPTPQLYFTVFHKDLDGGIQVTGSHNPGDQNGFKMMCGRSTLSGVDILELKRRIQEEDYQLGAEEGSLKEFDAASAYIADLIERSKPHVNPDRKLKIVVDAGNGVGGMIGPAVLRGLGCEVVELFCEPDGSFPNHHPDPTVVENLADIRRRVVEEKADVGIAWDGDADRIGVVDERGEVLFGDMLMVIYGRSLAQEINRPIVIGDVKCSELMFSELKKAGAQPVMWKTGHSLIKKKLKELDAHLAGEMSGHIFFSHRFFGFDDALHASARLIEILSKEERSLSQLIADLPSTVSTPELRVDCDEEIKFKVAEAAQKAFPEFETNIIDGVRIKFPNGWGLVRASNTQPVLVMRFEAESENDLQEYRTLVESRITELRQRFAELTVG